MDQDDFIEALLAQHDRNFVDRLFDVAFLDHALQGHVAEEGQLFAHVVAQRDFAAADEHVRHDADLAQLGHALLGRLGLHLAGRLDVGDEGEVDVDDVVSTFFQTDLADGLQEDEALDVADGPADFAEDDVHAGFVEGADAGLDLGADVRDHLHGRAQVVAAAFLLQDLPVDAAGGDVALLGGGLAGETLVVAQVEVGLGPVVGHVHLAVLERAHGAGVDVEIRVELHDADGESAAGEQGADCSGRDSLAEGGHDPARDEHILGHKAPGGCGFSTE